MYNESSGVERILPADLSISLLWRLWCEEHDPDFYEMCTKWGYWRTQDRPNRNPPGVTFPKPKMSRRAYAAYFRTFNLRFGAPRVDTCEDCDQYGMQFALTGDDLDPAVKAAHEEHLKRAAHAYDLQKQHKEACRQGFPGPSEDHPRGMAKDLCSTVDFRSQDKLEFQTQDAGGNLRTPRLSQNVAYYKRILQTYTYGIYSHAKNQHTFYFWNEVIGEKGVNNVISCEHEHHHNEGTGAKTLEVWFDACQGQCNNWTLIMYHLWITDPDLNSLMYDRIDERIPQKGHTYIECDRGFATITNAAKGRKTINDMKDWMDVAKKAAMGNHRIVEMLQDKHFNWKEFLSQMYTRPSASRLDIDGEKALIEGMPWRSYGMSEEVDDTGKVVIVEHPGEVWLKSSHDVNAPWDHKVDLRKNAQKTQRYQYGRDEQGDLSNIPTKVET